MITGKDMYEVISAMVPLYAAMSLAYSAVRWWRVFSGEQCAGINRFVATFAIPFLCFKLIAFNNPYAINAKLIIADTLQKIVTLVSLFLWKTLFRRSDPNAFDWLITLNSLSTLPNTLVMGIPLLTAMYGDFSGDLMVQIVVFQSLIWNTVLLVMFECRAAKIFINENFRGPAGGANIASFRLDSDVVSLADGESLRTEVVESDGGDGKARVKVRIRKRPMINELGYATSVDTGVTTPRASDLTGVEIYSRSSSNYSYADVNHYSLRSPRNGGNVVDDDHQIDMFVWHSSVIAPPIPVSQRDILVRHESSHKGFSSDSDHRDEIVLDPSLTGSKKSAPLYENGSKAGDVGDDERDIEEKNQKMPPARVMTGLILTMVWRKIIRNPNSYSSLLGLIWSLISFRWKFNMPIIIKGSVTILSNTGLGMSMFSLGLFMALQPKVVACGKRMALISLVVRFVVGPAVMAATSAAIGIRGVLLQVAIVQAALPQAIVSFVFAKEYNVHPQILSTSVTIGMVAALPVTILYYVLLGL